MLQTHRDDWNEDDHHDIETGKSNYAASPRVLLITVPLAILIIIGIFFAH